MLAWRLAMLREMPILGGVRDDVLIQINMAREMSPRLRDADDTGAWVAGQVSQAWEVVKSTSDP